MAEGSVEQSVTQFQQATSETFHVCLHEDSVKQETWFCKHCRQCLCDKCRRYHKHVSSAKSHEITQADENASTNAQQQDGEEGVSDELRVPMSETHGKPIEIYCQIHNTPASGTCKLMSHRQCQLQDLVGEVVVNEIETLEVQKDAAIDKIKRKMKKLEALGEKIREVEETFQQEREGLDRETRDMKKSNVLVEKRIKELERATNVGSEEEVFLATRQANDDIPTYKSIVSESSQVSHTANNFEVVDGLTDISSIGNVKTEQLTISVDITPQVIEVINTQQSDMQMFWLDVLPSDQIILLSTDPTSDTSHLRLYSTNKKLLSQLDLPPALSAAMLDDHQLIVALLYKQQLQIIDMDNNNLTIGPLVKTNVSQCLVLRYSNSCVLILALQDDGNDCFVILDLKGKREKRIKLSTDLQNPVAMRMSRGKNTVYIVDHDKGCLGFNLQGDTIFHYTRKYYDLYPGLAVDPHGALYISAATHDKRYS